MRKTSYIPQGRQEAFIVPLLAREIKASLAFIATQLSNENLTTCQSALDCGCGNQPFREDIIEYGMTYDSLDVTQNCRKNVDYVCSLDCIHEHFVSVVTRKYSLVMATEVLEHISDWQAAFRNISYCTAVGGYVLLTAPFFYPLHEQPYDFCRPTIHQFEKVGKLAGFQIVSIHQAGCAVDVIGTALGSTLITLSKTSSLKQKIINKLLIKSQKIAFRFLLAYRSKLTVSSQAIYLSNIVILKKVEGQ